MDENIDTLLKSLENDNEILVKWFCDNYFKANADKFHLLISNHSKGLTIQVEKEIIECCSSVKLLGVTIDNELKFGMHVSKLCKKASHKLHALARISNYMCQDKLRILMKAFFESQFGYCPLVSCFTAENQQSN